jgi:molecular chaperone HscB
MDPFSTLGLPRRYEVDMPQLETSYRELQKALHPDKHAGASASQRRMSLVRAVEVNEAYRVLKDDLRRAEALLAVFANTAPALRGGASIDAAAAREQGREDPEFLMEVLELREALGDAKQAKDLARVRGMAVEIAERQAQARTALVNAFNELPVAPSAAELTRVSGLIGRLKYFRRFLDEVSAIEEEALG